jgi:hypothetical protein
LRIVDRYRRISVVVTLDVTVNRNVFVRDIPVTYWEF